MQLSWSDQDRVAEALWATYPEQDRLALGSEELRLLIISLPEFKDQPQPPGAAWLDKILWTWMRIADERGLPPARKPADTAGEETECASPPCLAPRGDDSRS